MGHRESQTCSSDSAVSHVVLMTIPYAGSWLVGVGTSDESARELADRHNERSGGEPLTWRTQDVTGVSPEEVPLLDLTRGTNRQSKQGGDTYWIRAVPNDT